MSRTVSCIAASLGLAAVMAGTPARAGLGDSLVASGGEIVIRFEGSDAAYDSVISVNGGTEIFPNHATAAGTTFNLGSFLAGQSLDMVLRVVTTGYSFHTGPGGTNPDSLAHAFVTYDYLEPGRTLVAFEDIFGGGDADYNDHRFSFTNIAPAIPEPETYALMLAGLAAGGWLTRRRRAGQA